MANLFLYKNKAGYNSATDRPAQQSSVSYDGQETIVDGKNVILPFKPANAQMGDMVVFDTIDNCRKILKWKTYHAGTFDSSRYIMGKALYFGAQNGKGIWAGIENAVSVSKMWAEKCYFRLTGINVSAAGSFTFKTYYSWASHPDNVVSWDAGATLASIVATINGLGLSASYFKAAVLADGTGIGIWVNYPTTDNVSSIFSITAGGEGINVEYMNKYNGQDVVWQYVATSTIIPGRTPAKNVLRRNGLSTYWGGSHFAKFVDYFGTNGKAEYAPETSASPMNRATFNALAESLVEEEKALYDKYNGSYEEYMEGAMALCETARDIMSVSYDDAAYQSSLLGQVMTKDYDNNVIPAFPAAYYAHIYGVNAAVPTGFETGKWGLPTTYQMVKLIELVGLNANNKTDFNRAIDKFNAAGNFYGSGYYFWTCAECSAYHSFYYDGTYGCLSINNKNNTCSVRPVLALEWDA